MARRINQTMAVSAGPGAGNPVDYPGGLGKLMASAAAWNAGSVQLQMLGPDGASWLPVDQYAQGASLAQLTGNGSVTFAAPAGRLRVNITSATGVNASLIGLPANVAG
jgi:hypothetical protein